MKNLISKAFALPTYSFSVSDSLFLKVNPSPNNLKGNPYGLHCPQPSNRGSCPLINLSCPSAKHWISFQECCIIQHKPRVREEVCGLESPYSGKCSKAKGMEIEEK